MEPQPFRRNTNLLLSVTRRTELRVDVYEVDHPATQAYKRRRAPTSSPDRVRFVPVDFARQRVGAVNALLPLRCGSGA